LSPLVPIPVLRQFPVPLLVPMLMMPMIPVLITFPVPLPMPPMMPMMLLWRPRRLPPRR
jgi:hypothetical protein